MMSKYDYGIFGVWSGCNYGSVATYYALNNIITSMGKKVLMIDKPIIVEKDAEREKTHSRRFAEEHYDISKQYRLEEFNELNDLCNGFIIGSDQVWNYGISKNFGEHFYLDFANDDKKKIAYAVSFGHGIDFAPPEKRPRIAELMSRFDGISTREADGVRLCRDEYGIKATQVLDPVFLPDIEVYRELIKKSSANEEEPFLATYILDPTPEKRKAILHIAHELGDIKIVNMLDGLPWTFNKNAELMALSNCIKDLQVEDWLYYISNCKFLLTDSCHGASFAIIFKKNFIAITNKRRGFSRFKSLSELFKFEDRLVTDPKTILTEKKLLEPINYSVIDSIMQDEKKRSLEWLKTVIDEDKKPLEVLKKENTINFPNTVIKVVKSNMCMGCSACINICPKSALSFGTNEYGYYVPVLDINKCIKCGLCQKVCPALNLPEKHNSSEPTLYKFIAKDDELKIKSSSGGVFSLLAEEILNKNGAVVGCAWNNDFTAEHIMIENIDDLHKLRKSKYMQSYMGDIYKITREHLENGQLVLFSACPCQIAGLKAYLKKEYDNLYLIDLLCGNSPSAGFFRKYFEEQFPEGLKEYEFRNKSHGTWGGHTVSITKNDNSVSFINKNNDYYQMAYHPHLMISKHCEKCRYQSLPRYGDITIGDFWGIERKEPDIKNKRGVSAILCNNDKGMELLKMISPQKIDVMEEKPLAWLGGNGSALKGKHNWASPNRDAFYKAINNMTFSQAVKYAESQSFMSNIQAEYNSSMPLHYNTRSLHFIFDPKQWEEHYILGKTVLIPKNKKPLPKQFAMLPLLSNLKSQKKYRFDMRFKVLSEAKQINFHVMNSITKELQIIYKHKITIENLDKWQTVSATFTARSDFFDVFSVGATQVSGENRRLVIDYLTIKEESK